MNKQHLLEFSTRLKVRMSSVCMKHSPTKLAEAFNLASGQKPISVHAARKWLIGEAVPTQDKLVVLADIMGTTPQWLRFGDTEAAVPTLILTTDERILLAHFNSMSGAGRKAMLLTASALAEAA